MPYYYSPFRKEYKQNKSKSKPRDPKYPSIFCDPEIIEKQGVRDGDGKIVQNEYYYWMINWFPRAEGHTMVVPKRYVTAHDQEKPEEVLARQELMVFAMGVVKKAFKTDGCEFFNQHGSMSWRSIDHLHWHLMPVNKEVDLLKPSYLNHFEKLGIFATDESEEKELRVKFPIIIEYAQEKLQKLLTETMKEWNLSLR
jgi:diadenosine tetraphosphate (Ap4A) HIT family hydrolase